MKSQFSWWYCILWYNLLMTNCDALVFRYCCNVMNSNLRGGLEIILTISKHLKCHPLSPVNLLIQSPFLTFNLQHISLFPTSDKFSCVCNNSREFLMTRFVFNLNPLCLKMTQIMVNEWWDFL